MIANVSAHRRANAFAQALEELSDREPAAEQSEGQASAAAEHPDPGRLLALAECLGELPRPELDPEVKVVQRAQLVAAMEAMLLEGDGAEPAVPEQRSHRAKGTHRASPLGKLRPRSRLTKGLAAGGLSWPGTRCTASNAASRTSSSPTCPTGTTSAVSPTSTRPPPG